jgi:hypothetical protein
MNGRSAPGSNPIFPRCPSLGFGSATTVDSTQSRKTNNRLYQVLVSGVPQFLNARAADYFMESFQVEKPERKGVVPSGSPRPQKVGVHGPHNVTWSAEAVFLSLRIAARELRFHSGGVESHTLITRL